MDLTIEKKGKHIFLRATHDFSLPGTAKILSEKINSLLSCGEKCIVIDLTHAAIINSAVIGAIIECHKEATCKKAEVIVLTTHNRAIETLLRIHIDEVVRIIENESQLD